MRDRRAPLVIKLSSAQRAQIRKASGKDVATLRIEPCASGSRWLYMAGRGREAWLLKAPNPQDYRIAKRQHHPKIDPRSARFGMRVGPSRIHGVGVFAAERIPARRKVIEYTGELVNAVEAYRRIKSQKRTYVFAVNKFWNIDAVFGGSGAEFINHSCNPNLRSRVVAGHVLYNSARPIEVGEELTVDYQFSWAAPKVPCRCGSPQCRGTINLKK
jgi:uncharacterized protein